ncbi:hypothetical protein MKK69_02865 [Methylobacterium sp. J-026]|uniref:hypothetical protein n=1 Tax=Methylobacterium sp. J-026 TaxID=2836624 RepID=UPI001FBB2C11|nr:hypothetical protein [Methylobacterium sp. J-026]MCJ2133017.1 hypothetical protein [Methylobacterium sp. J-026]
MPSYLSLVVKMAFARWAPRTDLWSGALGALIPCFYVLSGRPVPDNVTTLVAEIAVGFVFSGIAVRLLLAPYLIWKSDQATIADLKRQLEEPARLRREATENAFQQARVDFAIEMRKFLYGTDAHRAVRQLNAEVWEHLNSYAALFKHDPIFDGLWLMFTAFYNREESVLKIGLHRPDPDGFIEVQVNRNLSYNGRARHIAAEAIIAYLTYRESEDRKVVKKISELRESHVGIGMIEIWDEASLNEALARRLPLEPEQEKQQ